MRVRTHFSSVLFVQGGLLPNCRRECKGHGDGKTSQAYEDLYIQTNQAFRDKSTGSVG